MTGVVGILYVAVVYGALMGLWWNYTQIAIGLKVNENLIRSVSGLMSGLILIPMSIVLYGIPQSWPVWSFIAAILLNIVIAFCYVATVGKTDAAVGSHVQVFGPVVALVVGKLILHEFPNFIGVIGVFLTLLGVYVFHQDKEKDGDFLAPLRRIMKKWNEWLIYALIVAAASGIAVPFDKINVVATNGMIAPGITQLFGWGIAYLFIFYVKKKERINKENFNKKALWLLVVIGICFGVANGFQGIAYTKVDTAVMVTSLKRLDALWAVIFCLNIFKQNRKTFKITGAIIIFGGILLMGLSQIL